MTNGIDQPVAKPTKLNYEADLCGNIEQALKGLQGYGIMAMELIQNADDAGARTLSFDARTNGLIVTNDAEFSSCGLSMKRCPWENTGGPDGIRRACNFHAISKMGSRNKIRAPEQIGRFGIGFVSVYQITDTPMVRSAGTVLRLNPLTGEALPDLVDFTEGTKLELPWATAPSEIRDALNASPTPPDVATRVVDQVSAFLRSSLLFLRHLERVDVRQNGIIQFAIEIERTANGIALTFEPHKRIERWLVLSRDADDIITARDLLNRFEALKKLDRSRTVSVAIPIDSAPVDGLLYAYLPTQQKTGMPLHINADFFPHASRQDIVLKGEGHERYWNEALLATAAAILGENFVLLRDTLGHSRLWQLGTSVFQLREKGAFAEFWMHFSAAAKATDSVWTMANKWHKPAEVHLAPEEMPETEQRAVASIGLELLDKSLRSHWSVLSSIGVGELRLATVTSQLEALGVAGITGQNPHLRQLWAAVARLIQIARSRSGFAGVVKRLRNATFLIDGEGNPVCASEVWWTPKGVPPAMVRRYVRDCPIVHPDLLSHSEIVTLIDEYTLDDFARNLAELVTSSDAAEQLIGTRSADIGDLYALLTSFPVDAERTGAGGILSNTPILRTPQGFISPARGQLPGGFQDPTGHFEFIDISLFPPAMEVFAREILGVRVLSFHEYIDDHLQDILVREPTKEQYRALLTEIIKRKNELDDQGSLDLLVERAFVKTRAGSFVRPDECYFWTASLESLLGDDMHRWVDNDWMPPAPLGPRLQDLFEDRLGMPTTVAARHIVGRLETIADGATPDEVAKAATPVIRHIIERWSRFTEEDLNELRELQNIEFLPAVVDGERDPENLYLPTEVYRAGRAPGFASQVPVIDLAPLRQAGTTVNAVLNWLEVPEEPETSVIVAHLQHCMSTETAPSDLTYALLNERVEDGDDLAAIDQLRDSAFIYDSDFGRFLRADVVFWGQPPFRGYWWAANGRMGQREAFYRRLGVRDCPGSANYAALVKEIAAKPDITGSDLGIHAHCLGYLCDALDKGDRDVEPVLDELRDKPALLNVNGDAIWPEDAVWIDSEQVAAPFGSALNYRLVQQPDVSRSAAARLFRRLGVPPISDVARLRLASEPDRTPAQDASEKLRDRADLVLWLPPNLASRRALRDILSQVRIQLTRSLRIYAEINEFDPLVRSPVSSVPAFLEHEAGVVHVEGSSMRTNEWPAAFRAIFSEIERHCPTADVKPLVMTTTLIMLSETREDAEQALRSSGYRPPEFEAQEVPAGEELRAATEDEEANDLGDLNEEGEDQTSISDEGYREDAGQFQNEATEAEIGSREPGGARKQRFDHTREQASVKQGAGHSAQVAATPDDHTNKDYKSKAGTGEFGTERKKDSDGDTRRAGSTGQTRSTKTGQNRGDGGRSTRIARMLAYVAKAGHRGKEDTESSANGSDISELIDIAAIRAALKYEEKRGWNPEEQPHGNPGYDIVSTDPSGRRRLIEVKGLEGNWTERGIKLSHVQYAMAEQHANEYWIYIIENARDLDRQKVSAIGNPFQKVEEYWFDHNWRDTAEETANSRDLNVREGARVRHAIWGTGTLLAVEARGMGLMVKVDFGFQGKKYIPFNSSLQIVD